MSKNTANYGAAQTRAEIKRHIRHVREFGWTHADDVNSALNELVAFIDSMAKRASKIKGGLGRR